MAIEDFGPNYNQHAAEVVLSFDRPCETLPSLGEKSSRSISKPIYELEYIIKIFWAITQFGKKLNRRLS